MSQYNEEIIEDKDKSLNLMILGIVPFYDLLREDTKAKAAKWAEAAPDKNQDIWLIEKGRDKKLRKDIEELKPYLLKVDNYTKARYKDEYSSNYFRSSYNLTQLGRSDGYRTRLKVFTGKQLRDALQNPLSKLDNNTLLVADRNRSINAIYNTIRDGVLRGQSLQKINRRIDIVLGYRDSKTGKLIAKPIDYKGDLYKRMRVLRTEVGRIRSLSDTDNWLNAQAQGISSSLVYQAVHDDRTRPQSAAMDGQVANNEGKFRYPDGRYYYQRASGNPRWDIHDRCYTIQQDPDFPEETRGQRKEDGSWSIEPYDDFKAYAEARGMKRNKWGQWYA